MSKPRDPAPLPADWQAIIGQIKSLLTDSPTGVLVVVIDQSTVYVANSLTRHTTVRQHIKGDCNSANIDSFMSTGGVSKVVKTTNIEQHGRENENTVNIESESTNEHK